MSTQPARRSILQKFFDSFFQEQNIRWMLAVGMAIVAGSSLMLVRSGWEQYQPAWRQMIVLLYGTTIYLAGELCRRRLALPRTAAFLQALTLLLIPVAFLALNLLRPGAAPPGVVAAGAESMVEAAPLLLTWWPWLLALTTGLTGIGAWRILTRLLRGPQPVYASSFLLLAAAGAVVPVLPTAWLPAAAVAMWCVFAIGAVTINREVFSLTEKHRAPLVAGYVPLCLLAIEFTVVFSLAVAGHISNPLAGLGLVLTAIPVLHAAGSLLNVFQQRTGALVPALPAAVAGPGLAGLLLCPSGMLLAAGGFPPNGMVVPAALIAGVLLLRVAGRTRREAFVWLGLVCLTAAYQFSPILFRQTAREVLAASAEVVRESRMPLAFYGLTWLPLLGGLLSAVPQLRKRAGTLFTRPIEWFSLLLTGSLFLLSFGHVKALFPVSLALGLLSVAQVAVFRRDGWLRFSLLAGAVSCVSLPVFLRTVAGLHVPETLAVQLAGLYALGLTAIAGRMRLQTPVRGILVLGARLVALAATLAWTVSLAGQIVPRAFDTAWMIPAAWELCSVTALLTIVLLWHAFRWPVAGMSEIALAFAIGGPALAAAAGGVSLTLVLPATTLPAGLLWTAGRMRAMNRLRILPQAMSGAALRAAGAVFCSLLVIWLLPYLGGVAVHLVPVSAGWSFGKIGLWLAAGVTLLWCFDAARTQGTAAWSVVGIGLALLMTAAGMVTVLGPEAGLHWLPLALAVLPAVVLWPVIRLHHRLGDLAEAARLEVRDDGLEWHIARLRAVLIPLQVAAGLLVAGLAMASLVVWTLPLRAAGVAVLLTAVVASCLFRDQGRRYLLQAWLGVHACWLVLSLVAASSVPAAGSVLALAVSAAWPAGLPLAAVAALMFFPVTWHLVRLQRLDEAAAESAIALLHAQRGALRLACGLGLFVGVIARAGTANLFEMCCLGAVFAVLCGVELLAAHRDRDLKRLANAAALAVTGCVGLSIINGIAIPLWVPAIGLVLCSLLLDASGRWLAGGEPPSVLAMPFRRAALGLPLVNLLYAVQLPLAMAGFAGAGMNRLTLVVAGGAIFSPGSLVLLLTGCVYLLYGLRDRRPWCAAIAVVSLNAVFAECWYRLGWHDPQVYCMPLGASVLLLVELLRAELPTAWRTPLRMAGGLTILVSPLFGVLSGSWLPLFTLMVASVAVTLAGIGLRVRSMAYLGTAFLLADLAGMVIRGSIDRPGLLWLAGLAVGGGVMALAAVCENHREALANRLRGLAAELETWQ